MIKKRGKVIEQEEKEPIYCINCGKEQTAIDINPVWKNKQCGSCHNSLSQTEQVVCLGANCKGKIFIPLISSTPDFERTTKCPLCGEIGQFVEVEAY